MAASEDVEKAFTKAVTLHQQGNLAQAESLYRQILQSVPHHLDALNLFGLVAMQTGRNLLAVDSEVRKHPRHDMMRTSGSRH